MNKPELSIIILNHNTRGLLGNCIKSLEKVKNEANFEVIVSDNGSSDGSLGMLAKDFAWARVVKNRINLGFAKGNNAARKLVKGEYTLFLNSDTIINAGTISETLGYLKKNRDVGAITCKIVLPDGQLDKDARRRFPTPWVSLNRLFLGNGKMYWYGDISPDIVQDVEVIQGAFFMARKRILDEVGWFDEDYYLDGEDVDLCWKIRQKGYRIIYYPKVSIMHLKKATKKKLKVKARSSGVDSMEIFYRKRLWGKYPLALNLLVIFGIRLLKLLRTL